MFVQFLVNRTATLLSLFCFLMSVRTLNKTSTFYVYAHKHGGKNVTIWVSYRLRYWLSTIQCCAWLLNAIRSVAGWISLSMFIRHNNVWYYCCVDSCFVSDITIIQQIFTETGSFPTSNVNIKLHGYIHTYTYTHPRTYMYTHPHTYMYTHLQTYMYTHLHTYMYTHPTDTLSLTQTHRLAGANPELCAWKASTLPL